MKTIFTIKEIGLMALITAIAAILVFVVVPGFTSDHSPFTSTPAEACCGEGGPGDGPDGGGDDPVLDPIPLVKVPTCDFTVSKTSLPAGGGNVTFTWTTTNNPTSASLWAAGENTTYTGTKARSNSVTQNFTKDSNFKLSVWNSAGKDVCEVDIDVADPTPAPTCVLKVNGQTVTNNNPYVMSSSNGGNVTVTWTSNNVGNDSTLWAAGTEYKNVGVNSGSKTVNITKDADVSITIWNETDTTVCPGKIVVPKPTPEPVPDPVCTSSIVGNKTAVLPGETVTFQWTSQHGLDSTLWAVGKTTGEERQFANVNTNGGSQSISITEDTEIFIDVWNGGNNPAQCKKHIDVIDPKCDISVSTSHLDQPGNVRVEWDNEDAYDFTLWKIEYEGADRVSETVIAGGAQSKKFDNVSSGFEDTFIDHRTTFQLDVWNGSENPDQCIAQVTVEDKKPEMPMAKCDYFRANGQTGEITINKNDTVNLTWKTTNGDRVFFSPVSLGSQLTGDADVKPMIDTLYTLRVRDAWNREDTCQVRVRVENPPVEDVDPICKSFTVNGKNSETIKQDQSVTLAWETENATRVAINNGVGSNLAPNDSENVTPLGDTTYIATVFDADGDSVQCPARVVTVEDPAVYTCESEVTNFSVNPTKIDRGENATLTWETTNKVASLSINNGVTSTNLDDSEVVSPTNDTTYVMSVNFIDGTNDQCPVTLEVEQPTSDPMPICNSFVGTPDSFDNGTGGEVTFFWTTTNADTVTISGLNGTFPVDGSTTTVVTGIGAHTFTLTATGYGKSDTCTEVITITDEPDPVVLSCEDNVSFAANPTTIQKGSTSTLTWSTTEVSSLSFNQGITKTDLNGNVDVSPNDTTTYTMSVNFTDGTSDQCPVTVNVTDEPVPFSCENNVTFEASPKSIDEGDSTTLSWNTTNVSSLSINNGISSTKLNDDVNVSPNSDTTYTMSVVFTDGTKDKCEVKVNVDEDNGGGGGGGGSSTPRCELDISDTRIDFGDKVTISWETRNASNIELRDDDGNVLVTTDDLLSDDKKDLLDGEITITPDRDTEYTLEATRGSRDRDCTVKVSVDDDVVVYETRDQQPIVAGIALTQVPYTGFEAGPTLTLAFYALLTAWALFVAYVLVVKQDTILGFSLPRSYRTAYAEASVSAVADTTLSQTEAEAETEISSAADYVASAAPVATAPANLPTASPDAQIGYQPRLDETAADEKLMTELEDIAHSHRVLISGDAMRHFIAQCRYVADRIAFLERVIVEARASYPAEDGWVVLNLERMQTMCIAGKSVVSSTDSTKTAVTTPEATEVNDLPTTVTGGGSLAEAIVTGNVVAAYQMIGNRPMIALADAAADLDNVYRARKGADTTVSELLKTETASLRDDQVKAAITALTGALDGVYTDESEAVKVAIMKAIKALS